MKILILGASGVIGQHMRLTIPPAIEAVYARRQADELHVAADSVSFRDFDAVVNLMGCNSPDAVQADPDAAYEVNVMLPRRIAREARKYIHVSTQAVLDPVNEYGRQKLAAETWLETQHEGQFIIARPTFVLGVRPLPHVGRRNPAEQMLVEMQQRQVDDRWFSVSFAREVARELWVLAVATPARRQTVNIGWPDSLTRYDVAKMFAQHTGAEVAPIKHDSIPGIAERPHDTNYSALCGDCFGSAPVHGSLFRSVADGIADCRVRMSEQQDLSINERAREIAVFLGISEESARTRLARGFGAAHHDVTADWRRSHPSTEAEILSWYRQTEAYIWELVAYHIDEGWNYAGQMKGICDALKGRGVTGPVLVLGDGVGDMTWYLRTNGINAVYHDLRGSRTMEFAEFVFKKRTGQDLPTCSTPTFAPDGFLRHGEPYFEAILSLDFLEHLPNVEDWASAVFAALKPGGLFVAQNAFNIGSGPNGDMPMHLECNDRFEKDWDPLLSQLGFTQICPQWYQKGAAA